MGESSPTEKCVPNPTRLISSVFKSEDFKITQVRDNQAWLEKSRNHVLYATPPACPLPKKKKKKKNAEKITFREAQCYSVYIH